MMVIKIEDLHFDFPKRFRLFIDELYVPEGEIFAIIGPNGAGKTTLLDILALFNKPKSGRVEIFGRDILKAKDKLWLRRRMSFIFSQPYLLNETVYRNVSLPLRLRGLKDNARRTDEMLDFFKIDSLRNNSALTLSQGQKHRVALARAFVTGPKLILLDEPFLSLDRLYKGSLLNPLRRIIKLHKTTAVFVTQDQDEALAMADTIAVMKNGRVLQQGRPQDIFNAPASKEVADFVGVETIIEGEIIDKKDNLCFINAQGRILEVVSDCSSGDRVFVCIRPENVVLSAWKENDSARNHLKGRVKALLNSGLYVKVDLDCGFDLAAYLTHQSTQDLGLSAGKEFFASFKATAAHLIKR